MMKYNVPVIFEVEADDPDSARETIYMGIAKGRNFSNRVKGWYFKTDQVTEVDNFLHAPTGVKFI